MDLDSITKLLVGPAGGLFALGLLVGGPAGYSFAIRSALGMAEKAWAREKQLMQESFEAVLREREKRETEYRTYMEQRLREQQQHIERQDREMEHMRSSMAQMRVGLERKVDKSEGS